LDERSYRFWRNFAWICAGGTVVCLVGSVIAISLGTRTGWVTLVCCVPLVAMSVIYFRLYRRLRQARSGRPERVERGDGAS
jgi:uncharacterized membrane protein YfcA